MCLSSNVRVCHLDWVWHHFSILSILSKATFYSRKIEQAKEEEVGGQVEEGESGEVGLHRNGFSGLQQKPCAAGGVQEVLMYQSREV